MPAAVMYKGRAERPRRTGTAWVAVPTRRSVGIGATPVGGITLSNRETGGAHRPPFGADHKASMMLAALMQNQVICTAADHLPATGRAV